MSIRPEYKKCSDSKTTDSLLSSFCRASGIPIEFLCLVFETVPWILGVGEPVQKSSHKCTGLTRHGEGVFRPRDRLDLQRDVRQRSDQGNNGNQRGDLVAFAVTGGNEVGDRGGLLTLAYIHQLLQKRVEKHEHQDGAEIDGEEGKPGLGSVADRAEKGPGSAIDCQRKSVDQRLVARNLARWLTIAPVGDIKKYRQVSGGAGNDEFGADQGRGLARLHIPAKVTTRVSGCQA